MITSILDIPSYLIREYLTGWTIILFIVIIIYFVALRKYYLNKESFNNEDMINNETIKTNNKDNKKKINKKKNKKNITKKDKIEGFEINNNSNNANSNKNTTLNTNLLNNTNTDTDLLEVFEFINTTLFDNLKRDYGLIGQEIVALSDSLEEVQGLVDRVTVEVNSGDETKRTLRVHVGSQSVDLNNIREVTDPKVGAADTVDDVI